MTEISVRRLCPGQRNLSISGKRRQIGNRVGRTEQIVEKRTARQSEYEYTDDRYEDTGQCNGSDGFHDGLRNAVTV